MSWHLEVNALSRADALLVWDRKIAALAEYTREECASELAAMRACIDRLIDLPNGFWIIKTYGDHYKDERTADHLSRLRSIFFEIKRGELG